MRVDLRSGASKSGVYGGRLRTITGVAPELRHYDVDV